MENRALEHLDYHNGADIVEEARTAGPDAFRPVFRRYSKPVLVFIYGLVGDRGRAEELTQETFIRAYRRLHTIRQGGRFSTWLFGIARNVVREAIKEKYRTLRRTTEFEPLSGSLADPGVGPDERVMAGELRERIQTAVTRLPEDLRIAFVLKLLLNMPYEEMSDITGASIGKLKTDLHRARQRLRDELQPYIGGDITRKRDVI